LLVEDGKRRGRDYGPDAYAPRPREARGVAVSENKLETSHKH